MPLGISTKNPVTLVVRRLREMGICTEAYVARIANATPLQLVIINYEIVIDYIKDAKKNINDDKKFNFSVLKSRQFLNELRISLNMKYELSRNLMGLYNYIDRQLAYFQFNKKLEHAEESLKIMKELLEGWKAIEDKEEDKTPIMQNTQQLYAGLTYGRNGRMNEYVDTQVNRGFKA